jgi:tRNA 2-thiouridine synthesizing protein B
MSTLHIVRKSAYNTTDYLQCSQLIQADDTVVFCDDGCYNLTHEITGALLNGNKTISLKVISSHALARAIIIPTRVNAIDMNALVNLTFHHEKVITWQ